MRISFYQGFVVALIAVAANGVKIAPQGPNNPGEEIMQEMAFAQTGAEAQAGAQAMYFKKIVNFAKDAIHTIAPSLSSMNKDGTGAGLANLTGAAQGVSTDKPGKRKANLLDQSKKLGHQCRHPKPCRGCNQHSPHPKSFRGRMPQEYATQPYHPPRGSPSHYGGHPPPPGHYGGHPPPYHGHPPSGGHCPNHHFGGMPPASVNLQPIFHVHHPPHGGGCGGHPPQGGYGGGHQHHGAHGYANYPPPPCPSSMPHQAPFAPPPPPPPCGGGQLVPPPGTPQYPGYACPTNYPHYSQTQSEVTAPAPIPAAAAQVTSAAQAPAENKATTVTLGTNATDGQTCVKSIAQSGSEQGTGSAKPEAANLSQTDLASLLSRAGITQPLQQQSIMQQMQQSTQSLAQTALPQNEQRAAQVQSQTGGQAQAQGFAASGVKVLSGSSYNGQTPEQQVAQILGQIR